MTRLQKLSNLIKNDYYTNEHLVNALMIACDAENIPIIQFLLTFDVDNSIIILYILTKYKVTNIILNSTVQQLSDGKYCQQTLKLMKEQIQVILVYSKDLVIITKSLL